MRSDKEIDNEVQNLIKLAELPNRWNDKSREILQEQIEALRHRSTAELIERSLYVDETTPEYQEGDNELYNEVIRAVEWMNGNLNESPSKSAG